MRSGLRDRVRALNEASRSQLWPLPVLAIVVSVVLGVLLPELDSHVDSQLGSGWTFALFGGDDGAARTLLNAVASSLVNVTSLTFSLTVVTLQLASSQFSPRLLRTFAGDLFVQATLGLFLATFTYSLVVLRSVRSASATEAMFVPRLAVSLSFALAILCVIGLVVFLAHLTQQIRVERMLRDVHRDARSMLAQHRPPESEAYATDSPWSLPVAQLPVVPPNAKRLLAPTSGFLVRVERDRLTRACAELDVVMVLERPVGSSLIAGTPVGWVWPRAAPAHHDLAERIGAMLERGLVTGYERTSVQDLGYGLRQLTDVANKALSPGINDPTTAVHALGHISALLCQLTGVDLDSLVGHDDDGVLRLVLHQDRFDQLVETAIDQIRRYGAGDPQVMERLLQLLAELAWHARGDQRDVVRWQLTRTRAVVAAQDFDETELARLADFAQRVEDALDTDHDQALDLQELSS